MTARIYHREHSFSGSAEMESSEIFDKYEQELFTAVVAVAEKEGKHVSLVVVPTNDVFEGIVATAQRLGSTVVVCGLSNKLTADEQGKLTGDAWERLPEPRPRLTLVVVGQNGERHEYQLGPHRPRVRKEDVDLSAFRCGAKPLLILSSASCTITMSSMWPCRKWTSVCTTRLGARRGHERPRRRNVPSLRSHSARRRLRAELEHFLHRRIGVEHRFSGAFSAAFGPRL